MGKEDIKCDCPYWECMKKLKNGSCPKYLYAKYKVGDCCIAYNVDLDKEVISMIKKVRASVNGIYYDVWPYDEEIDCLNEKLNNVVKEELIKPSERQPKYKVGTRVYVSTGEIGKITSVDIHNNGDFVYGVGMSVPKIYNEENLREIVQVNRMDAVMCSDDGKRWNLRLYYEGNQVYAYGTASGVKYEDLVTTMYIVPIKVFDFNHPSSNTDKSIV